MEQSSFFQRRSFMLIAGFVIIIVIAIVLYWTKQVPPQPRDNISKNVSTPTLAAASSPTTLQVSPISPISPMSPLTNSSPDEATMELMVQQGIDLYNRQDYNGAVKTFNDILAQDSNNYLAYNARGTAYIKLEKYDQAIADYSKAITLHPLFADAYYNRGRAYRLIKKYDQAIVELNRAIQLSPTEFGYRANGNIGLIYHQQGLYDKALEAFATAISYDDSKADTYYLRGETYTVMRNYEAAIQDYQAAISRFPNYSQAYQGLGYAYYKTEQFEQAQEALHKAAEMSPNSPAAHFYLMLVYLATGQGDQTKTEVSQAMDQIGALSEEEQNLLFKRVLADLDNFSQKNPANAQDVEALIKLIPEPHGP